MVEGTSGRYGEIYNPAVGELIRQVAFADEGELDAAVQAASQAFSAWEFLLPVLLICFAIGVIQITIYSPFASAMMQRYEQLEERYLPDKTSLASISGEGLWLRQTTPDGHYILHVARLHGSEWGA